jgi:hypothetical protein
VLAPFNPLRERAEMEALFFNGRELLEIDFEPDFDTFARTFFRFATARSGRRLGFADFFSAGRPRPFFFECFAKTLCL